MAFPAALSALVAAGTLYLCYIVYEVVSRYMVARAFTKHTAVDELSILGQPRDGPKLKGTAVICGGSMAGMFSAIACANHWERVVIIEADDGADTNSPTEGMKKVVSI